MAEESQNEDEIAEEMMRMMEAEVGGEASAEESGEADAEIDLEAAMREAMEAEGSAPQEEGETEDLESQMLQAMMSETGASTPQAAESALQQTQAMLPGIELNTQNVVRLMGVNLSIAIELGRTEVPISTLLEWSEGSLIELDKVSGEAIDVLINGKPFAKGEVVTIAENFGVRLVEILPAVPRSV